MLRRKNMELPAEPSMQATSKWEVVVNKEKFVLDGKQLEVLKEATKRGIKGLVWFKNFAISIPHISSISKINSNVPRLPELPEMSQDKIRENFKRLAKLKENL